MHGGLSDILRPLILEPESRKVFDDALRTVWEQENSNTTHHIQALKARFEDLEKQKGDLVIAIATGKVSKEDANEPLERLKREINDLGNDIDEAENIEQDFLEFVGFTMDFINNMQRDWWNLDEKHLVWCKQLLFPEGFSISRAGKVYTPKISEFYTVAAIEKGSEEPSISQMVTPAGFEPAIAGLRTRSPGPLDEGANVTTFQ